MKLKTVGFYVNLLRENEIVCRPRYNDFVIEVTEELPDTSTDQKHNISLFIPTLFAKITKSREDMFKQLLGCQEVLLLKNIVGESRKLVFEWWDGISNNEY